MVVNERVPHVRTESHTFRPQDRFDRWRAGIASTFNVHRPASLGAHDFAYDISFWQFGKLLLSDARFGPRLQTRLNSNIRSDHLDHYRFLLQTSGTLRNDADGLRNEIKPGEILVSDMSREERYECDGGSNIVLFVPRELLDEALPRPFDLHGVVPRGAAAQLLADHLRSMARMASLVNIQQAPAVTQATVSLLAASILPSAHNLDHASPTVESTLLRQICRYIDLHLSEPELSAESVTAFFGISRSALYRMLEPMGGVARYIKERRLARTHSLLETPGRPTYITRIADDHGFKSATHFSRAFREQFGYSPSDVRRRAATSPTLKSADRPSNAGFDRWIRSLRD